MAEAGRPAFCPDCMVERHRQLRQDGALAGTWTERIDQLYDGQTPMRRLFGVGVLVQNHSVSDEQGGNLRSFGQHERPIQIRKDEWLANERRRRLEYEVDNHA